MRTIASGIVALFFTLALTLAGCASPGPGTAAPTKDSLPSGSPSAAADPSVDPAGLVGLWRVTGAEGEGPETWLRVDALEMQLWRDCGMVFWEWAGLPGVLRTVYAGASGECVPGAVLPEAPWLTSTVAFERTDEGWLLRDGAGSVTATLTVDGEPEPIPTADEMFTRPPELDHAKRSHFDAPAALPEGLEPIAADQLVGRWVPAGFESASDQTRPFVDFDGTGAYKASDGCNGAQGVWLLGTDGRFVAAPGAMTLIGCEGAQVPGWVGMARLAALAGDTLVLLTGDGEELGRLTRA